MSVEMKKLSKVGAKVAQGVGIVFIICLAACNMQPSQSNADTAQTIAGRYKSGPLALDLADNGTYKVVSLEPITDGISESELMQKKVEDLPQKETIEESGTYTSDGKSIKLSGSYLGFPDHQASIRGNTLEAYDDIKGAMVVYSKN